jgi:hypothetical protein
MEEGAGHPSASELVEVARGELADVEREFRSHRFLVALDDGRVPLTRLGERCELDDQAVAFFDVFAEPSADFERRTLAVLDAGLRAGDCLSLGLRAARLLQVYELLSWDAVAERIT